MLRLAGKTEHGLIQFPSIVKEHSEPSLRPGSQSEPFGTDLKAPDPSKSSPPRAKRLFGPRKSLLLGATDFLRGAFDPYLGPARFPDKDSHLFLAFSSPLSPQKTRNLPQKTFCARKKPFGRGNKSFTKIVPRKSKIRLDAPRSRLYIPLRFRAVAIGNRESGLHRRPGEACLGARRECSLTTESKAEGREAGPPPRHMGALPPWRRPVGGRGGAVFPQERGEGQQYLV